MAHSERLTADSIYPITQLYFKCDKCGAEWMIRPDPPITGIDKFKAFTDMGLMGPCPKDCGGRTCAVAFRAFKGPGPAIDPFSVFKKTKDSP